MEEVQFMLQHHTAEHFPFLGITGVGTSEMRCRSMLYTALGRLLMVELGEDEERFHAFMMPLTAAFESIIGLLSTAENPLFASEDAKKTLIGLARDLRGLAFAFNTKTTYMMLFDWIYPCYLHVLIRGIELWYSEPGVSTPVLKLCAELAMNRNQRLHFDACSPNGILLFRELSNVIQAYGQCRHYTHTLYMNRNQRLHFDACSPNGILLFRELSNVIQAYGQCRHYTHTLYMNRNQRLHFDACSPNGILLFRELSNVIQAYGQCRHYTHTLYMNRNQRLHFDACSPNGILLFRELSNVIQAYGQCRHYTHTLYMNRNQRLHFDACSPNGILLFRELSNVIQAYGQCRHYTHTLYMNRNQRLHFDACSPNGILLFRELSNVIQAYGSRILTLDVSKKQMYTMKLKGISLCFCILKAALCGNYANFGVFRLYGDEALDNALNMFVKLLLSIPQNDLLDYPKLSQTYYVLLERLAQDHMPFLANLQPEATLYILCSISEGLTALNTSVCTGCCATLDHIVTYLFKQLLQKSSNKVTNPRAPPPETSSMFVEVLQRRPEIMQQLLVTVLNVIMFEDCCNQWSMSRPLLGLILLNEDQFGRIRQEMIAHQPQDKQAALAQWFSGLMAGIEPNLLTKNRDRFTQNLSMLRRDINDLLKGTGGNAGAAVNDMMT
ncbi:hypothetical protein O0L34_g6601 [Tuta absoluta]|nr:hypothetical protein O0L34_g6601 [Tuta absoluta]